MLPANVKLRWVSGGQVLSRCGLMFFSCRISAVSARRAVKPLGLNQSREFDDSILKGAPLLTAWGAPLSRSTTDIDLRGRTNNELEHVRGSDSRSHALFAQLCSLGRQVIASRGCSGALEKGSTGGQSNGKRPLWP